MTFDQVYQHIDGFGRYQALAIFVSFASNVFVGLYTFLPLIAAYPQRHQCSLNATESVPGDGFIIADQCHVYRNNTPSVRIPCTKWTYDTTILRSTIVQQFDLVCGRDYLVSITSSLFIVGFVIGSTIYGILADKFGRLIGIFISTGQTIIFGLVTAFSPTFLSFAILRVITGIGTGGMMTSAFTMAAEVTDPPNRVYSVMVKAGYSFGAAVLALIGYITKDHFWMQITISALMLITFSYPFLIKESPRWLMATGRTERAAEVIEFIAYRNKRELPGDFDIRCLLSSESSNSKTGMKENIFLLFSSWPTALTFIIVCYYWFLTGLGHFGVMFNLDNVGGNVFFNVGVVGFVESICRLIVVFIAKRLRRVVALFMFATLGGCSCLLSAMLIASGIFSEGVKYISFVAAFLFGGSFVMSWVYTMEVFPTVIRAFCLGFTSTWSRIGGTVAPLIILLDSLWKPSAMLIMAIMTLAGGFLSLVVPETSNEDLTDTMVEGKQFIESGFGISDKLKTWRRQCDSCFKPKSMATDQESDHTKQSEKSRLL